MDVAAAAERGIVVTNTPDVLTEATAELTWALILAVTRRIAEGDRAVRSGRWKGWALDYMLGMQLRGKQLGVVGLGRIGTAVASRAPAFGMSVAAASLPGDPAVPVSSPLRAAGGETAARRAAAHLGRDHAPRPADARHAPPDRSRTPGADEAVGVPREHVAGGRSWTRRRSAWALGEHLIAGAALDVYEREPAVHPALLALENVVLAPHLGSATTETRTAMADLAVSNVLAVLAGLPPLTPVVTPRSHP